MAAHLAAGLLMFRVVQDEPEFFLVHPGGPFFKNKDFGAWSIPKGLPEEGEALLATAQREFNEETGLTAHPPFYDLGTIQQKGGKIVHAWAFSGDWDSSSGITCNTFTIEWPPKSGKFQQFPEADKASWMNYTEAIKFMIREQVPFLDRVREYV
jgi:predicted NUDIX family NTP pyrophosphohydrolase